MRLFSRDPPESRVAVVTRHSQRFVRSCDSAAGEFSNPSSVSSYSLRKNLCFHLPCQTGIRLALNAGPLSQMLRNGWGLPVERQRLEDVTARCSFEKLSGGRERGKEDVKSHYRKGVHGDWRNHFTPAITCRFKALLNNVLVMAGYEKD